MTMNDGTARPVPPWYDGTGLRIYVDFPPDRTVRTGDLFNSVDGIRITDGAAPLPYYRDAQTGQWWSLSYAGEEILDVFLWTIELEQVSYKPRDDARSYLQGTYADLLRAAEAAGGIAVPECDVDSAVEKMERVVAYLAVRDYEAIVVVAAAPGHGYPVEAWWVALKDAALVPGDGDLFRDVNGRFVVEPYSRRGYFHPEDFGHQVIFPDVAFRYSPRGQTDPLAVFRQMAATARTVAEALDARVLSRTGEPFEQNLAEEELVRAADEIVRVGSSL
jgi:hypothetical protein